MSAREMLDDCDAQGLRAMLSCSNDTEPSFEELFECLPDAVIVVDAKGAIVRVNGAAERSFGYSRAELVGACVETLIPGASRTKHAELRAQFLVEAKPRAMEGAPSRLRARRKDGTEYHVDIGLSPLRRAQGTLVLATIRDVSERYRSETERERLTAQLRQAQRMDALGTLAAGIAHDFNNLLLVLGANVELLREQPQDGVSARESLDHIELCIERAASMVRRILTFSREAGPGKTRVDACELVDEVIELLRTTLPCAVELETRFTTSAAAFVGDSSQLHQVLVNLCTNAWHALEGQPGRIVVGVDELSSDGAILREDVLLPAGRYVHIYVADNGGGMLPEVMERMFEPFFTTKPDGKGTGLGLAVVLGIVKNHAGEITVESRRAQGTTVHLYLQSFRGSTGAAEPASASKPATLGCRSVLCVDDEPMLLRAMNRYLTQHGFDVTASGRAAEAFSALQSHPERFDALVIDIEMPGFSGIEVAHQLASMGYKRPMIAIASGVISPELRERATASGVARIVGKPYRLSELAELLHELCSAAV